MQSASFVWSLIVSLQEGTWSSNSKRRSRFLIESGIDKSIKNVRGHTAADLARSAGHEEISQIVTMSVSYQFQI